jgi:hypothetical protein
MNDLYYIEYDFDGTVGELYCVDSGFGIIEIGVIEDGKVFEEDWQLAFDRNMSMKEYINTFTGTVLSCTKVL